MADDWDHLIELAARRHNVDPRLMKALMLAESSGNPNATGAPTQWGRAEGLFQFIPPTARSMGIDPRNPAQAIDGAARLLAENLDRYGTPEQAILAYHGGTDTRNWGPQTRDHLVKVNRFYAGLPAPNPQPTQQGSEAPSDEFLGRRPDVNPQPTEQGLGTEVPTDEFLGRGLEFTPVQERRAADTSWWDKVGSGVTRGLRDALDAPAEWLARKAETYGVSEGLRTSALGRFLDQNVAPFPDAETLTAQNRDERQRFETDYGDSGFATAGRVLGQIAPTVAMLSPLAAAARGTVAATGLPANLAARTAVRGGLGAAEGAASGYILADPNKPLSEEVGQGAAIGAGVGAVVNPLVGRAYQGARDFFTPPVTPERAQLAKRMGDLGVDVYGPQILSRPGGRPGFTERVYGATEVIPFSGQPERMLEQAQQWTRAMSKTMGEDTPAITRQTIQAAKTRIGDRMNEVARNSVLNPGAVPDAHQRLLDLARAAADAPLETNQARSVARYLEYLADRLRPGGNLIPGDEYQRITAKNSPLAMFLDSDNGTIRQLGSQAKEILDDVLEASSAPGMRAELRDARSQWKAMMTMLPLVHQSPDGVLNAQSLMKYVLSNYDAFKKGGDTGNALGDLAEGARAFLGNVFRSDTALNQKVLGFLNTLETYGPMAALAGGGVEAGIAGAAASAGVSGLGRLTASTLSSNWYRNQLMNKALGRSASNPLLGNLGPRVAIPGAVSIGAQPEVEIPGLGVYASPPGQ